MFKNYGVIILLFFISAIFQYCSKSTEPGSVEFFKIKVDSVESPNSISLGDTVNLRIWGFVGSNGCYSFSNFESSQSNLNLDLTVWGKYTPADACATVIVEMRGSKYSFVPTMPGKFEMAIHQPDGSVLKDTIVVQ